MTYSIPAEGDTGWGPDLTAYFISIASNAFQKTGGAFTLTAEADFGASFGLKTVSIKSKAANPASSGFLRLGSTQSVSWRNNANNADLALTTDASDNLLYNSKTVLFSGLGLIVNADVSNSAAIAYSKLNLSGSIVNADVSASAAIAYSKLAALTASRVLQSGAGGVIEASAVTTTELGYVSGVAGQLSGNSQAATLQNKTLDNSNIITVRDDRFTIQDNLDTTKQAVFQLSGITTGTTRTITVADANITLVGTDTTQTITNKSIDASTNTLSNLQPCIIVRDEKANGTNGGTSSTGTNTRVLNTVLVNTITGASLSLNQVTLPAGTYDVWGTAPVFNGSRVKTYLYNATDAAVTIVGESGYATSVNSSTSPVVMGRFTIAGTKAFELRQYIEVGAATNGNGIASSAGMVEVYGQIRFTKVY